MTHVEIAAEQIVWWQREEMSIKACLHALGRKYNPARTWGSVFSALVDEARRMNPVAAQITAAVRPIPDAGRVA